MPRIRSSDGQTITFFLALGAGRQMCRLATTFLTQKQAFSYLHRNRTAFERMARAQLASGELDDGIIVLTMLQAE